MARANVSGSGMMRWTIRVLGSAAILALLFWLLPMEAMTEALATLNVTDFVVVLLAFLAIHVVAGAKWWLLLDRGIPVGTALKAHFAGLAANLCLPGAVGGDALRAAIAHRTIQDGPRVAAVATADRLIDMVALAGLSMTGLFFARQGGTSGILALKILLLLALVVAGIIAVLWFLPRLWRIAPNLPGRAVGERLTQAFGDLARKPGTLLGALILALIIQSTLIFISWWLACAAGAKIALSPWFFAWPLAKIAAVVPISLNGLGLREGVLAALLLPFGAASAVIVAAGLVWQGIMFSAGMIGALIYLMASRTASLRAPGIEKGASK